MKILKYLLLPGALSLSSVLSLPSNALASAVYYCTGGGCTGDGGNGDNGTNNGNNSSNNANTATGGNSTVNLNLSSDGRSTAASGARTGVSVPIQLPSFSSAGCGARPTIYTGLTGSPGNGLGIGNTSLGFGLGLLTPVGREPDSCKPPVVNYTTYISTATPARNAAADPAPTANASSTVSANADAPARAACVRLDYDVAEFYAHDLRLAKHTYDTVRIDRDIRALETGCFHTLAIEAIAGK